MKVQALDNGFYVDQRIRKGDIFELVAREGVQRNPKTGKLEPRKFTAEEQFSESWMRKLDGQDPLPVDALEEELNLPGVKLKKPGRKKNPALAEAESVI